MTTISPADRAGRSPGTLAEVAPDLAAILAGTGPAALAWPPEAISRETVRVAMRDGTLLATELYRPPVARAPAIAVRTPYGRRTLEAAYLTLARAGYAVVAQDCRGTGDSEPEHWDFYLYEREDSLDFVSWVTGQDWHDGFLGAMGGSYVGGTQWCMAMHPAMTTIAPEVAGLGVATGKGVRFHMYANAYAKTVGKGADKVPVDHNDMERQMLPETLATGYFNDPLLPPLRPELLARYPQLAALAPGAGGDGCGRSTARPTPPSGRRSSSSPSARPTSRSATSNGSTPCSRPPCTRTRTCCRPRTGPTCARPSARPRS